MADVISRISPLERVLKPGVHASAGGVSIEELPDMAQFQLIARKGEAAQLAGSLSRFLGLKHALAPMEGAEINGLFICATGPLEYWVFAEGREPSGALRELGEIVGDSASLFDQSAGRCVIRLAGKHAANVLAKGTSLDLQGEAYPSQGASHTVIDHIPALAGWRTDPARYDISVPRSYAGSFIAWLSEAALEYGFSIE